LNLSLADKKVGLIGLGNMGQAILSGWVGKSTLQPDQIYISNRSPGKVEKMVKKFGVHGAKTNEELVDACDIIILGTKPQDLFDLLEPISSAFTSDHVVMSLAAGIELSTLKKYIPDPSLVRLMTNTPILAGHGVIGFTTAASDLILEGLVKKLFSPLGCVVSLDEGDPFSAFTVASSSGTGFILEFMAYWQDWVSEHGIDPEEARKIVVETFLGTALLAQKEAGQSFHSLTEKVASKKGVTAAGLESIRELELEGMLRMSFNKSVRRNQELGRST